MRKIFWFIILLIIISISIFADTTTVDNSLVVASETQGSVQETQAISLNGGAWYLSGSKEFSLINNTGLPIDLSKVHLFFNLGSFSGTTSIWSSTINNNWNAISQISNTEYIINSILEPGSVLKFTLNLALNGSNLKPGPIQVTAKLGEIQVGIIDISAKASNTTSPAPSEITVSFSGPTLSEPITQKISSFGASTQIIGMPVGTYTVTATIPDALYSATLSPSSITVSMGQTSSLTVFYKKAADPSLRTLTLTMPAKPASEQAKILIPASVNFLIKDANGALVATKSVAWNKSIKISNLKKGVIYQVNAVSFYNGTTIQHFSQNIKLDVNQIVPVMFSSDANATYKKVIFNATNLGTGSATLTLNTKSFGGISIQISNIKNGVNSITLPVAQYNGSALSLTAGSATLNSFDSEQIQTIPLAFTTANSGTIIYHVTFPFTQGQYTAEKLPLTPNYTDLIMSNFVAGVLLGQLLKETPEYTNIHFNKDYLYGSILAQLLQENIDTTSYNNNSNDINPSSTKGMILASGQGGPYQLNDYSKRLENSSGAGLINFVVLQKSLGYSVADQDNGAQTARTGPDSLDNKYFGPIAATYFHYNDIQRMVNNNKQPWGPQAKYFTQMMNNFSNGTISDEASYFDMLLNACYNAGSYSDILTRFVQIGANYTDPTYQVAVSNMGNYSLNDSQYNSALGMNTGGTYILYPRQVRFYLDQLYNTNPILPTESAMFFSMSQLKIVFAKSIGSLGYVSPTGTYEYIPQSVCETAFDTSLATNKVSTNSILNISSQSSRLKIYAVIETALQNVSSSLNIKFNELTEKTLNGSK